MTINETIKNYCKETNVWPPFSQEKIKRAGHDPRAFLLEFKERLEKADDVKSTKDKEILDEFFKACQDLA